MKKSIGTLAFAMSLAGLAAAQTVSVPAGDWAWQAELDLGGLTLDDAGHTCISEDQTELDLGRAALNLNEACNVFGLTQEDNVTRFTLVCLGDESADLAGVLTVNEDTAELRLTGDVRLGESRAIQTVGIAQATRNGAC